jgi:hypothetical protein
LPLYELDCHINDAAFADAIIERVLHYGRTQRVAG